LPTLSSFSKYLCTQNKVLYRKNLFKNQKPDVVVHNCNPSYSRDRGRRLSSSRPAQVKVSETQYQPVKSYVGSRIRRIMSQASGA
jgi:hypothetical protein